MIQELATLYRVHPNLVALWKKQLQENAPELFERTQKDKKKEVAQHKEEELYKEIEQLPVENEFLKKITNSCTGPNRNGRAEAS